MFQFLFTVFVKFNMFASITCTVFSVDGEIQVQVMHF